MAEPMRVRATQSGDLVEVRILMKHEMTSRLKWDIGGRLILPHFIQTLRGTCNGKPVLHAHFGGSVSKDPYFAFKFRGGKTGDNIIISWVDTEGGSRTDETVVV